MKKSIITFCIFTIFGYQGMCQLSPLDKSALEIPVLNAYSTSGISSYIKAHFSSDTERLRAIFVWVANNINYDVDKIREKRLSETVTVTDVLKTRKAVCQGYSELFIALCNECNIRAILVPGYSKFPDGSIPNLAHAWVAANVENKWYLYDPTWAAGYLKDNQFNKTFSNRYCKVLPEEMIKDHMPFDPMYQFLNYPLSYNDFNRGNTLINSSKSFFNYTDTISQYNAMDTINQSISLARRINGNGEKNNMIYELIQILNKNQQSGESKVGFDAAVAQLNQGTALFNRYIDLKNKRFASVHNDNEIQQMIDSVLLRIRAAYKMLEPVLGDTNENKRSLQDINNALSQFYRRVDEENIFLKTYFKRDRASR